jgi:glycosyltransferase involved in cell wall biosynthesis
MSHISASVILLTFNQEAFVAEALQSLLDQDYDDLEIVVSDDASVDNTWDVVSTLAQNYVGSKKIILNRNSRNAGIGANYTKAFLLTTGSVIFSAAGDDVSLSTRCADSVEAWVRAGMTPDLVATDAFDMTLSGEVVRVKKMDDVQDWTLEAWFVKRPYHFGASHMMTRRMLALNSLHPQLNAEDQCLMFRALLMGGALRVAKPLVKHRQNGVSYKQKPTTYALKKAKLIKDAQAALIESEQMLGDAACLKRENECSRYLQKTIDTQSYVLKVLTATSWLEKWRALRGALDVTWGKRLRFFSYAALPWVYMPGMWLKSVLKR